MTEPTKTFLSDISSSARKRIAVEPANWRQAAVREAVAKSSVELCDARDASGLIWVDHERGDLPKVLHDDLRWVQLPFAGIEPFLGLLDDKRLWTCGKGIYAEPVAEHVLALILAGFHNLPAYAAAQSWQGPVGRNLKGATILIVGGGGIAEALLRILAPFDCQTIVLRKHPQAMRGATRVCAADSLDEELVNADVVVLAAALTEATYSMIGARELQLMRPDAWLINVGRGALVVTDALVAALRESRIGGAALDVTEPEPLPEGHPLWALDNCLITPHVGNTPDIGLQLLAQHSFENVQRLMRGEIPIGAVDVEKGY